MDQREIAARFERLGPWVTRFEIDGHVYGGDYDAAHDAADRVVQFHTAFPDVGTILELGSLEGGHTIALAQLPGVRRVVGIEGRDINVERSRFALAAAGVAHAEIVQADLEAFDLGQLGRFDAVFNCGLLYHLPEPERLLVRLADLTDRMYLSTHYHPTADTTVGGYPGGWHEEYGIEDPMSGLSTKSFWPTRDALITMLRTAGFGTVDVTFDDVEFPHGPLICLAARRA